MTASDFPSSTDGAAALAQLRARHEALAEENTRLRQQLEQVATAVPDDNAFLLAVLETGPSAIVVLNRAGEIRYANRQAAALLGLGRTELLGRRYDDPRWQCAHVDGTPWRDEDHAFAQVRDRGIAVHGVRVRISRADGARRALSINGAPIRGDGAIARVVLTVDDITEAFETAERLRESEEWRAAAMRGAQLGVWSWEVGSNTVRWSPELYPLFELQPGEFDGSFEAYRRLIPVADWPAIESALHGVVVRGESGYVVRHSLRRRDGGVRWIEGKARMHRDADGRPLRLTGTAMDITDRVHAENALRESEARLRALTDSLPFSIWMRDRERRVVFQNHASRAAFGDIPGTTPERLGLAPDTLAVTEANLARALAGEHVDVEVRVTEPTPRVLRLLMAPLRVGMEIIGVVGANLDLTAQRKLEQQLQEAAKIESLGRLAAGVAHDFNNLLAAIMGLASVAASSPDLPSSIAHDVDGILAASRRGAALTQRLLAFARRKPAEIQVLNAAQIVERSLPLARAVLGAAIELQVDPGPGGLQVRADPNQVEQVLLNLLVNARDAMPRGGLVTLAVRAVQRNVPGAETSSSAGPQSYVAFAISDRGPGIAPEVRARLFEPFFTTKPVGQGTGLGLSGSLEIARSHGGFIDVDTELGLGSTFALVLPRADTTVSPAAPPTTSAPNPGQGETVLVVEDDTMIRETLARQLRSLGYRVLTAADAHLALEVALTTAGAIDLLVTDLILPRLSGVELARLLRGRAPQLGVIYITGDAASRPTPSLGARDALLTKPFDLAVLAAQLRALLGGK